MFHSERQTSHNVKSIHLNLFVAWAISEMGSKALEWERALCVNMHVLNNPPASGAMLRIVNSLMHVHFT